MAPVRCGMRCRDSGRMKAAEFLAAVTAAEHLRLEADRAVDGELGRLGIRLSAAAALLLLRLDEHNPHRKQVRYGGSNLAYLLKSLEDAGMITRKAPDVDRRQRMIRLTPQGVAARGKLLREGRWPDLKALV